MDYKYISQLLERYWNAETTLEEEEILKAFFRQDNVPADLLRSKALLAMKHKRWKTTGWVPISTRK